MRKEVIRPSLVPNYDVEDETLDEVVEDAPKRRGRPRKV